MVSTGATIVEIDQKADMYVSKASALGHATLLGPIDPSAVMAQGTPDLVMAKAREAIEILGQTRVYLGSRLCAASHYSR
jgi:hypothetical protein